MIAKTATAAAAVLCLGGCGGADKASAPAHGYRPAVRACLEKVGYELASAGNATRISSADGAALANLQFFPSAAAARRAGARLVVDGAAGGRAVAVFFGAASVDRRVIADCLTP